MLSSWSHSKLVEFDKCKRRTFLLHVQRVPEPERPLPPGKSEHANERGSRVHDAAERFVRGLLKDLIPELRPFEQEFLRLRELFRQGLVSVEGNWGYDREWNPTDWRTAWHRSKLDAIVFPDKYRAIAIDYKTGKRFGNEVKHGEQLQLYALDTVMRYPEIEEVTTELWYPDVDELASQTYTREQCLKFRKSFQRRGDEITSCTDWPPNPNIFVCRYCDYGSIGQCNVSAKDAFIKGNRR
jgi:hypothetical protein